MAESTMAAVTGPSAANGAPSSQPVDLSSLLTKIADNTVKNAHLGNNEEERQDGRGWIEALLNDVVDQRVSVRGTTKEMLASRIAQIDELLSDQINEILHAQNFQKLEATWRGVDYVVKQTETSPMLKIKMLNVSKRDLINDFRGATEFDQSHLFKMVYEQEYGTFGGHPFGAMIGDYEFGRTSEDMEILEKISGVAASAHAPFIAATNPSMFEMKSFADVNRPRDLSKIFTEPPYIRWRAFREKEDSRYVGLVLPHILMREPYGSDNIRVQSFDFEEDVDGKQHDKYLWGNPAFAYGARITSAFSRYNWCTAIRGPEGGGMVEDLPIHTFKTDQGDVDAKCPTEIAIPDRREKEFSDLGFIALLHEKSTNRAAFFSGQSAQKPAKYKEPRAQANSELSAKLPYILAISRFAHYLKAIGRDKIGSFTSRDKLEDFLNNWIAQYVLLDDHASQDAMAQRPLRDARIKVEDIPGKPGAYSAIAHLRPHFQLDALNVSLRLVAEIPARRS